MLINHQVIWKSSSFIQYGLDFEELQCPQIKNRVLIQLYNLVSPGHNLMVVVVVVLVMMVWWIVVGLLAHLSWWWWSGPEHALPFWLLPFPWEVFLLMISRKLCCRDTDMDRTQHDDSLGTTQGLFGFKELGGSEVVGSVFSYFRCSSKHRKRKIEKVLFFFSFLFYTTISSLPECYS